MPRKSSDAGSDVNKTQIIREHLARNPDAMPKSLAEELQKLGYDVKPQHVSTVKFHMKREVGGGAISAPPAFAPAATLAEAGSESVERQGGRRKPGRKKRGRKARSAQPVTAARPRGDMSFESLRKAKDMADQLGGVARAKQALDALAQLVG